jgi:hypothetical protein
MQRSLWLLFFAFSMVTLAACRTKPAMLPDATTIPQTENPTSASLSTPASTAKPVPTNTISAPPTLTTVPTTIPTTIPPFPITRDWLTYVHPNGVSIQYPKNWQIEPNPKYYYVDFRLADSEEIILSNYRIRLEVFARSPKDKESTNPYNWQPNEGGYEVHWAKPISIDSASGLEFVWGSIRQYDHTWDSKPYLYAIYYSEQYELAISLWTIFDSESLDLVATNGFTNTISSRFNVFEYMAQSIQIEQ